MAGKRGSILGAAAKLADAVAWLIMAAAAFAASPASADSKAVGFPDKAGIVQFSTPSANIECTYTPKDGGPELSCDRANPKYVRIVISGPKGALTRIDNPRDQPCCIADHVLEYGKRWTGGPFTCNSDKMGLACRHIDGHEFFLGLKSIRVH